MNLLRVEGKKEKMKSLRCHWGELKKQTAYWRGIMKLLDKVDSPSEESDYNL
jgi:hypothetical protein